MLWQVPQGENLAPGQLLQPLHLYILLCAQLPDSPSLSQESVCVLLQQASAIEAELRGVHSFLSCALSLTSMFALLQQASAMEAELRAAKDKVDLAQAKKVCLGF